MTANRNDRCSMARYTYCRSGRKVQVHLGPGWPSSDLGLSARRIARPDTRSGSAAPRRCRLSLPVEIRSEAVYRDGDLARSGEEEEGGIAADRREGHVLATGRRTRYLFAIRPRSKFRKWESRRTRARKSTC